MGKASSQTMMVSLNPTTTITKKKKGRPSRQDLQNRSILQQQQQLNLNQSNPNSLSPHFPQNPNLHLPRRPRSTRRIPIFSDEFVDGSDFDDDDDEVDDDDDDDDERVEKKVKLVGRLPNSSSFHTDEINAVTQDEKGTSIQADAVGPTTTTATNTSLPHKKLLLLILDKLQKKDTRGVFAEPVDPEELPDYHEVIKNPMDFETVRKKLDGGLYLMLEQFEADIYLICSNAMQYNAPSTIFFRQARSIQELAKKEFETLRQDGGQSEPPPKPRRGRPPGSRNLKKLLESSSVDRGVPESASDATLAPQDDDAARSNSYNLRKGPSLYRFPRNLETCFDFPASSSRSISTKYGKKHYESDESRRETYNLSGQVDSCNDPSSLLTTFETFENELIPVGLDSNHSYARSLARFSGDLGPAVWRIVSKKIKSVLPPGVEFGPGWVNDNKASSSIQFSPLKSEPHYPSTSNFANSTCSNENSVEARGSSPGSEWSSLKGINAVMGSGSPFQIQQGPVFHSGMNGTGGFGSGFHFQPPKSHFLESGSLEASRNFHGSMNTVNDLGAHGMPYWESPPMQERWDKPYPSDSNVGFQASRSRSSRVPIGSPPQLDLVLQL